MSVILRVSLFLLGVLYIVIGFGFVTDPVGSGADFGIAPMAEAGTQGLATIRGDLTSFFWVLAGSLIIGAWKANTSLLKVGAALVGIVFVVRGISAFIDGTFEGWLVPMGVELLTVVVALAAARILPEGD